MAVAETNGRLHERHLTLSDTNSSFRVTHYVVLNVILYVLRTKWWLYDDFPNVIRKTHDVEVVATQNGLKCHLKLG